MKTEFKSKFLQHMIAKKRNNEGFTLIELLVVIIIIGILSAIALPSFLNQASKAKQSEAKNTIGAVNSAQTAHRLENPTFAGSMDALALGLPATTENYTYAFPTSSADAASITAATSDAAVKKYSGGNSRYVSSGNSIVASIICEGDSADTATAQPTGLGTAGYDCPSGFSPLGR